jgi:putative ABC transport system permease protein
MTDLRLAFRMMAGRPGMSALAIVALALGIGLTTIMFSIVNGVLLRGLPFERSERIYHFSRQPAASANDRKGTLHDLVDWDTRQRSFEPLSGFAACIVPRGARPVWIRWWRSDVRRAPL